MRPKCPIDTKQQWKDDFLSLRYKKNKQTKTKNKKQKKTKKKKKTLCPVLPTFARASMLYVI